MDEQSIAYLNAKCEETNQLFISARIHTRIAIMHDQMSCSLVMGTEEMFSNNQWVGILASGSAADIDDKIRMIQLIFQYSLGMMQH